jgi:hypothetical protein
VSCAIAVSATAEQPGRRRLVARPGGWRPGAGPEGRRPGARPGLQRLAATSEGSVLGEQVRAASGLRGVREQALTASGTPAWVAASCCGVWWRFPKSRCGQRPRCAARKVTASGNAA